MRKTFLTATAMLAALSAPAFAADMPVKAPVTVAGYPYAASGFYFGVGASAEGQNASVANTGVVSTSAGLDGIIGYQWKGGLDFVALEAIFTYNNLGNTSACASVGGAIVGCSLNSQFEFDPRVKFGFPVSTLTALLPNLSQYFPALPALPTNFVPTSTHPYVYADMPVRDVSADYGLNTGKEWLVQGGGGAGILNQMGNGVVVDISAGCDIGQIGFLVGPTTQKASLGTDCKTRIGVLY